MVRKRTLRYPAEDKVFVRFLDGNGGRIAQQWYMNSDASITEHNLEELGITFWSMQRLLEVGIKKADATKTLIPMHFGRRNVLNHGGRVTDQIQPDGCLPECNGFSLGSGLGLTATGTAA
jgi:hypothetical protein